ncbi:hypothetical protein ACQEVC_25545 [Plantactinospora sp. CA-294935]|uniref:hypothetical protein n=1 Tax=Plantactinospora sp. CA-294935 TaxID=3240012 RepID=UPI003D8BEF2D
MRLHTEFVAHLDRHRDRAAVALRTLADGLAADQVMQWSPRLRAPLGAVPLLLDAADHSVLAEVGRVVGDLLPRLPRLLFGDLDGALDAFGVPAGMRPFIRAEVPREIPVARTDFLLGDEGWRLLEINNGASVGGLLVGDYDRHVRAEPFLAEFLDAHRAGNVAPVDVLVAEVLTRCADLPVEDRPRVAIVDWAGYLENFPLEYPQLAARYRAGGLDPVVCAQTELRYANGRLWHGRLPVHAVHRDFVIEDLIEDAGSAHQILAAAENGDVVLVSGFRHEWLAQKGSFAMLHEAAGRGLLTAAERDMVDRYVPPTWMLTGAGPEHWRFAGLGRADPLPLVPEALIVKPCIGSLGAGVVIGALRSAEEFRAAVRDAATATPSVLQRLVSPMPVPFPWLRPAGPGDEDVVIDIAQIQPGLFTVAGRPSGWWCRLLPDSTPAVANALHGAARGSTWCEAPR